LLPGGKEEYSLLCCCLEGQKRRGLDLEFGDCGDSEGKGQ